jgi:hypothetical protein
LTPGDGLRPGRDAGNLSISAHSTRARSTARRHSRGRAAGILPAFDLTPELEAELREACAAVAKMRGSVGPAYRQETLRQRMLDIDLFGQRLPRHALFLW